MDTEAQFKRVPTNGDVQEEDDEELSKFIGELGGASPDQDINMREPRENPTTSVGMFLRWVGMFLLALLVFKVGMTFGSGIRSYQRSKGTSMPVIGIYLDPKHNNLTRSILPCPSLYDSSLLCMIGKDTKDGKTWQATSKVTSFNHIVANFTSKDGPSALKAQVETNGNILWEDGNTWIRKKKGPSFG